jgi:hypothetical protein
MVVHAEPGQLSPRSRLGLGAPMIGRAVAVATLLGLVAGIPLSVAAHQVSSGVAQFALVLPFTVVGVVVAKRQPGNPIGWMMLAIAPISTIGNDAGLYAVAVYRLGHTSWPWARLAVALTQCWLALFVLLPLPVLLFPDGRLPSRRWHWTVVVYAIDCMLLLVVISVKDFAAFTDHIVQVDSSGQLASFSGSTSAVAAATATTLFSVYALVSLAWVIGRLFDYRRATGERRQQLKWLFTGGAVGILGFSVLLLSIDAASPIGKLVALGGYLAIVAIPVSIAIGILKYRLYDIDRLISRTVSYTVVTGLLVAVYVAMIALTTRVIPLSSSVGVAASTLAAVGLFTPLRRRVQYRVDRRFNRASYDSDAMVSAFTQRLRDAVQLDTVRTDLLAAASTAVEPSHIALWIRPISR